MRKGDIIRFLFILFLWLALCYIMVVSQPLSLRVILVIIASAIIVFVPIYKKYKKSSKK